MASKTEKAGAASFGSQQNITTLFIVFSWFVLNISIASVTKWVFLYGQVCISENDCKVYNFPLAMTVIHLMVSHSVCYMYIFWIRKSLNGAKLDGSERLKKVGPLAVCFAASVGMGNLSLKYIFPSFKQMVGAGSPLVTVAMAVMLTGKQYNWWTWLSMPLICGGLCVCGKMEVNFSVYGTIFCVGAMVLRSAKSLVQQRLLSKEERIDPVTLLYYMAPFAAALVMIMVCIVEGVEPVTLLFQGQSTGSARLILLLVVSGLNACFLNISGFFVTRCTSAVTLQVLGSVKSCVGILISVAIFRNPLRLQQVIGMGVCIFGVVIYERKGGSIQKRC